MKLSNVLKAVIAFTIIVIIIMVGASMIRGNNSASTSDNNTSTPDNNEIESADVEEESNDEVSELMDPQVSKIIASMHDTANDVVCYSKTTDNAGSRKAKNMHAEFEKSVEELRYLTYLDDDLNRDLDMLITLSSIYAYDDGSEYQVDAGIWAHRILHDLDALVSDTYSNANYDATMSAVQHESAALAFIDSMPEYDATTFMNFTYPK